MPKEVLNHDNIEKLKQEFQTYQEEAKELINSSEEKTNELIFYYNELEKTKEKKVWLLKEVIKEENKKI